MKTLLVRPGTEVLEKTLRGPWPEKLKYLEKLYKEPGTIFRGLIQYSTSSHSSTLAVGAVLKTLGEDVEFLDVPHEFGIPLTEELNVKRHNKIENYIAEGGYDVVGISCTSSAECLATKRIAEAAKRVGDAQVVIGGYQATADALDLMKKIPAVDAIVLSDFEPVAEQLYAAFNGDVSMKNIPNLIYREDDTIRASERKYFKVESGDLLPYDYSLARKYIPGYSFFALESSRGCPYECSFCQEKVLRQSYTMKEASAAVDEIIDVTNYIGQFVEPVIIVYSDALWGANRKWVKDFCSELADRRDEISTEKFGWGLEIRVGQFDDEILSLMKKAGCITIGYGVESLSPTMLKMMNKTRDPDRYITSVFETAEKTLNADLEVVMIFLFGMPGETCSTIEETLKNMRKLPVKNESLHLKIGLPIALHKTTMDEQIHDPQFVKEHGVRVLDENDWEKAYIPRFTLLFDPSRELSASELTDTYIDFVYRTRSIAASFGRQVEAFKDVRELVDKDEISPEVLAKMSVIFRDVVLPQ